MRASSEPGSCGSLTIQFDAGTKGGKYVGMGFGHNNFISLQQFLSRIKFPPGVRRNGERNRSGELMALYFGTDMLKAFKGTAFHDSLESLSQKIKAYLSDELLDLLRKQNFRREKDCPFVFHRAGKEIFDLRGSWKKACEEAGIPGKLFHDFRRRAVRNLTRSGTQETVAMLITGHKTRSVFDKYNITSQEAIKVAMQRQEEYLSRESVTIP